MVTLWTGDFCNDLVTWADIMTFEQTLLPWTDLVTLSPSDLWNNLMTLELTCVFVLTVTAIEIPGTDAEAFDVTDFTCLTAFKCALIVSIVFTLIWGPQYTEVTGSQVSICKKNKNTCVLTYYWIFCNSVPSWIWSDMTVLQIQKSHTKVIGNDHDCVPSSMSIA